MNRKQFFAYHANNGGKRITLVIAGNVENLNYKEFNNMCDSVASFELAGKRYSTASIRPE